MVDEAAEQQSLALHYELARQKLQAQSEKDSKSIAGFKARSAADRLEKAKLKKEIKELKGARCSF